MSISRAEAGQRRRNAHLAPAQVEAPLPDDTIDPATTEGVMNDVWLECPNCHTRYSAGRLGVAFGPDAGGQVTIRCSTCKTAFNADLVPSQPLGWIRRNVLRQTAPASHTATTSTRE